MYGAVGAGVPLVMRVAGQWRREATCWVPLVVAWVQ